MYMTEYCTRHSILHGRWQMGLVDYTQDPVCTISTQSNKSAILDDKDAVVWVGYNGGLILRDLYDDETKEGDDGIRDWRKNQIYLIL